MLSESGHMRGLSAGFWMMASAVALRAASVLPALLANRPGLAVRVSVAVLVFGSYLACTAVLARRAGARAGAPAANLVWAEGGAGLGLAVALLWLL